LVAALFVAETMAYGQVQEAVTSGSIVLSVATALLVVGRHRAPVAAALVCSALLTAGALLGRPVYDGFWFPLAIGTLAWALTSLQSRAGWLTLALLTVCALGSRWLHVPDNVGINAACLAVAVLGAAGVARSRRRRASAQEAATARSAELQLAAEEAVQAERLQLARELHDLMSHAVSVIAVQAGAAELLWPDDPAAARRAIGVVATTAQQTVSELDRLLPGGQPVHRTMTDVKALVARMADAGLAVRLSADGDPPAELVPTVYRVVQESLTNALRYAPDGAVDVDITTGREPSAADTTRVGVTTHGAPVAEQSRRGYGLVGLGERVAQSGGTLAVNRRPETNSFEVTAVLPWRSTASAS
jgi:signal transduction histidine kinase